jgi:hypothetical protein
MRIISGSCSLFIGLPFGNSPWPSMLVGLVWGFAIVAEPGQFSMMVTE